MALHSLLDRLGPLRPNQSLLPIPCRNFQSYHRVSTHFLENAIITSEYATIWDMFGTIDFFNYLTKGRNQVKTGRENANAIRVIGDRQPDYFRSWGFVPQSIVPQIDASSAPQEMTFFDALIHVIFYFCFLFSPILFSMFVSPNFLN